MPYGVFTYVFETANVTEISTSEACVQSSVELRQHVTFPNHFQVPEALKSGLTFGSFDTLGPSERSSSGTDGDNNTSPALESSIGNDKDAISRFVIEMLHVLSVHIKLHISHFISSCLLNGVEMMYDWVDLALFSYIKLLHSGNNYNLP